MNRLQHLIPVRSAAYRGQFHGFKDGEQVLYLGAWEHEVRTPAAEWLKEPSAFRNVALVARISLIAVTRW